VTTEGLCLIPMAMRMGRQEGSYVPAYHLGWCHGPSGTGRTWWRLAQVTGDDGWIAWLDRSARSLLPGAIPPSIEGTVERVEPPGTWPNTVVCHGSAGNALFLLGAHAATGDETYLNVAYKMMDDCISRSLTTEFGMCWPELIPRRDERGAMTRQFHTGYSTGTAGVAAALVRMHVARHGKPPPVRLPDDPFN